MGDARSEWRGALSTGRVRRHVRTRDWKSDPIGRVDAVVRAGFIGPFAAVAAAILAVPDSVDEFESRC